MVAIAPWAKAKVQQLQFQGNAYNALLRPLQLRQFDKLPREILLEGPTGTGKSICLAAFLKVYLRMHPGANVLVLRKIKADLSGSFMQMWEEEILDWNDPWDRHMLAPNGQIPSHRSRDNYGYPNAAKVWCRGMDQWARVKSMAYDWIWMMEGTEFLEEDLMGLHTRVRKRVGVDVGWRGIISDVNPEEPGHWWNLRANDGDCARIKTTLRDNPGYYDAQRKRFKPDGQEYIDGLRSQLKGHMAQRYINGEWCAATGAILPFDQRHTFLADLVREKDKKARLEFGKTHPVLGDFVELEGFFASYDWGKRHAGTLQVWGVDDANRQYLIEEVYHSEKPLQWWADWAIALYKKYDLQQIVCDSAASDSIERFNQVLEEIGGEEARIAIPCKKRSGTRMESNLEVLHAAFSDQPDGKPAVFLNRNSLAHAADSNLKSMPKKFAEEIPSWVYAEQRDTHKGRVQEKPDPKCADDGLDACCYARVHLLGGRRIMTKLGTGPTTTDPYDAWKESYWNEFDEAA